MSAVPWVPMRNYIYHASERVSDQVGSAVGTRAARARKDLARKDARRFASQTSYSNGVDDFRHTRSK